MSSEREEEGDVERGEKKWKMAKRV